MQDHQLNQKMSHPKVESEYVKSVAKLGNRVKQLSNRKAFVRANVMEEFYALKQCGISVGETNCVHLANVLKTIATEN
jgi:hypothetical protein